MKKVSLLLIAVVFVCLVAVSVTRDVEAHQTDTPHLKRYECWDEGYRLKCKFYFHNPVDWGSQCPHTLSSDYLVRTVVQDTDPGCALVGYFKPVPPQGEFFGHVWVRWLDGSVVRTHEIGWGPDPIPTSTSRPTPGAITPTPGATTTPSPPQLHDPYFTGYECTHYSTVSHCYTWLYLPEEYTGAGYGFVDSEYFWFWGYSYDEATRTWEMEVWFHPPDCGGVFATAYAFDLYTGREYDHIDFVRECD